jgi:hypothetical protein
MRKHGRNVTRAELNDTPPFVGILKVGEVRDHVLGRPVIRARLIDPANSLETDLLPELGDVQLLWAESGKMRLTGIERLKDFDVAQTWAVELD